MALGEHYPKEQLIKFAQVLKEYQEIYSVVQQGIPEDCRGCRMATVAAVKLTTKVYLSLHDTDPNSELTRIYPADARQKLEMQLGASCLGEFDPTLESVGLDGCGQRITRAIADDKLPLVIEDWPDGLLP